MLKIVSKVSDKNSGDIGHPIQFDSSNSQWYINVSSDSTENNLIEGIKGNNNIWIGLYKNLNSSIYEPDSGWEWTSGEQLVFENSLSTMNTTCVIKVTLPFSQILFGRYFLY